MRFEPVRRNPATHVTPIAPSAALTLLMIARATAQKEPRRDRRQKETQVQHGVRLGLHCSSSSAGLTAILLVMGVMDLRVMAVVTTAITAERLAPAGERVARGIGVIVVCAGVLLLAQAAGLH